ncbi:AAA domain-containing protein [Antarcticirhabdus aurantiaca]|uniref:AAA domain-containing protein n=1 Tax=Antarcticirhabdus aurantiaca TaxID=2606717 RepID=A0ACD4NNC9_9HYPH|nr:AAA domain-containing protein [Antarcticirhabdus aurantiaca]WAJ28435.1 AAA domain-containing protein [Jeongeuplla avenae]
MKIKQGGEGIHIREISGIERFRNELPATWYGWSNLDCVIGAGTTREIDLILVSARYIFLLDLKDWNGKIESVDGGWSQNDRAPESSPVQKISRTARELGVALGSHIKKSHSSVKNGIPQVKGLVVITGNADYTHVAPNEKDSIFRIDELLRLLGSETTLRTKFGNVAPLIVELGLQDPRYQKAIQTFFNGSSFKPGRKLYQDFVADDQPDFVPKNKIYAEYEARGPGSNNFGTLRNWDFSQCPDPYFMTSEGRLEIAGRERDVYSWLKDRSDQIEGLVLPPRYEGPSSEPSYWQIFDRRQRMRRLQAFVHSEGQSLLPTERVELVRQLLAVVAEFHRQDAAHLDIAGHSVWIEAPTSVRLSHLFATRYPQLKTLGDSRFQFLSTVTLPDDVLEVSGGHKRRDVFCAAVAAHQLLFGAAPDGDPCEWNPSIDEEGHFSPEIHSWFDTALCHYPQGRFEDAVVAHKAFLSAASALPSVERTVASIEGYRRDLKTQGSFIRRFPSSGDMLKETDRVEAWKSDLDGKPVIVKLWKQPAWNGDLAAVRRFLDRAENLRLDRPGGFPVLHRVHWLGDAFATVLEWVEGETLAARLSSGTFSTPPHESDALELILRLIDQVDLVHESNHRHGDLTPANVIVTPDGDLRFIDFLDFSSSADGEPITSHYAPDEGDAFARDRYAVTRMVEEIVPNLALPHDALAAIAVGIQDCRTRSPRLSTLSPLRDAVSRVLAGGEPKEVVERIALHARDVRLGPISSDEGLMHVRLRRRRSGDIVLHLRGGSEELTIRIDEDGVPNRAYVDRVDSRWISKSVKEEIVSLPLELDVVGNSTNDWSFFHRLLQNDVLASHLRELRNESLPIAKVESDAADGDLEEVTQPRESVEEALAEEISKEQDLLAGIQEAERIAPGPRNIDIDVAALWQSLIEIEDELTTQAVVAQDSVFNEREGVHRIAIDLTSGVLDYSKDDRVAVEVSGQQQQWHRIGNLDIARSTEQEVIIPKRSARDTFGHVRSLVSEGQTLRFTSHFEQTSLRRRKIAVERMLQSDDRRGDLLSAFVGSRAARPRNAEHTVDEELLRTYGLNEDQQSAFRRIVGSRPLGLLQGPPGTGKTRFISALTHYAITKGLARNVLLTSQSHEAVNTASETVLRLFRKNGVQPSMLRVGMNETVVSPDLRPYHTSKAEEVIRDRFRAAFPQRLDVAAARLGIEREVAELVLALEGHVHPLALRYQQAAVAKDEHGKCLGLMDTLICHLEAIGLTDFDVPGPEEVESDFCDTICRSVMSYASSKAMDPSGAERFRRAVVIGKDFVNSVSRGQRNFEAFLAGTRQIVAGTCVGLGRESLGLTTTAFDLVIVDEAARCTPSELLVPLQAARWTVLVGDHKQLKPQHDAEVVSAVARRTQIPKYEVARSDFERVFETHYGHEAGASLRTQYRMLPPIGRLVSTAFYPELDLRSGREEPYIDASAVPPTLGLPLTWIETDGLGEAGYEGRSRDSTSRVNRSEADTIVAMIEGWIAHQPFADWLEKEGSRRAGIGVICMYAAQRDEVHRKLRNSPIGNLLERSVKIGTVDSYQGKENPIVVLSLVRNNADGYREQGSRKIQEGFLSEPNRINVAASRAMDRLVIVGARQRWRAGSAVQRLADGFASALRAGDAELRQAGDILRGTSTADLSSRAERRA